MADFERQFKDGMRLTTAQIYYRLPDHPNFLQEFIWQDYDFAPKFPILHDFLGFWVREIEGKLHSVYVASHKLVTPGEKRFVELELSLS